MRHKYQIITFYPQLVAVYANMSLAAVFQLDIIDYLILRRDMVISLLSKTKSGVEYLNDAWCREQTEPDREALHKELEVTQIGE